MTDIRSSHKAQNLARIRDNQRRSRARRKEYLQELEAKLRNCEQVGIEASSEIQSAARRVLDENRKLRTLLHERGVSENEVVAALGGHPDRSYDQLSTGPMLSAMLDRRITSHVMSSTSSPAPPHTRAVSMPRHLPSVPRIAIPVSHTTALSCNDTPSPGSIVSSMGTPPPAAYSTPFYTTPVTPPAGEIKAENMQYDYTYEQPYSNTWDYSSTYSFTTPDPISYYNSTSCADAANIIRTMRTDTGPQLGNEMGCHASSQHFYDNNTTAFSIMEKYPNQHAGV
ncbi:hypothetical protein ACN47E_009986 [Coniothyrium glycines]